VANTPRQQRIRRAELLAGEHPFASEILGFYIYVSRFQQGLYERTERASGDNSVSLSSVLKAPQIASFPEFLAMVENHGPQRLAEIARTLRSARAEDWNDLLNSVWLAADRTPSTPVEFLALTFLQPLAEFARTKGRLQLEGYTHPLCPFCNRKPGLGVLRPLGDGAQRRLMCGFCLTEWEFRRVVCSGCGQEDHAKLPVYTAESFPHIRVECCDSCQTYLKSIDLAKNGLADPFVDELASIPLDLWAQEHGYAKLHPNLFGM
jgi:FdhE protein